jgi:RNA polymerase sigma-70 factor (TIGR02960 family)
MHPIGADLVNGLLNSARAGDHEAFEKLVEPYRRELFAHCYRILGSLEDAEDMLQESLLRIWKRLDSFEGRASLRAWLYKVTTNTCLDGLDARRRRGLPREMHPRGDPSRPLPGPQKQAVWVDPLPEEWIDGQPEVYPEARYEMRESITLAFVAALQHLPGRQRAALLLCDVMGWSTAEAAGILEMSPAAMNSALQRARAGLKLAGHKPARRLDEPLTGLLSRYVAAWEAADAAALVAVLREDVALTMPPLPLWFGGRDDIRTFLEGYLFKNFTPFCARLVPVRASGAPAYAVYQRDREGIFRAAALHVLTIEAGEIRTIDDFLDFDGKLFARFGLPLTV